MNRTARRPLAALLLASLLLVLPGVAPAAAGTDAIPEPLAPWRAWVLRDAPQQACPELARQPERRHCLWPGVLEVVLAPGGAAFRQRWESLAANQWLMLPGDAEHWPRAVQLDGAPAAVIAHDGSPALLVASGAHEVAGQFIWEEPPQALALDPGTALVTLRRDGAEQPAELDADHRLWLRAGPPAGTAADSLRIEVFRRLDDAVPLYLHTELRLTVTGTAREVLVGRLLPAASETVGLESPLPARIETDGRLRVQLRPGEWRLVLDSRYTGTPERFAAEPLDPQWPAQEIWTFRADPNLRGVALGGAPAADPARLDLPPDFAGLPTHLVSADAPLTLTQDYRGDARPAAPRLQLERALWLDFDGGGATARDRIGGSLSQGWRLQATPALALGRAAVDGEPQVVTRLPGQSGQGIEVRATELHVETVGRLAGAASSQTLGWAHDFAQARIELNLPPGWQLWHASGPDQVQSSWLSRWNLWDLFLCLLIVGAALRVLNWRWSLVAAAMLALTYQEPGAPTAGWVALVAAIPLLRALPAGRARAWLRLGAWYAMTLLVLVTLGFAVQQVRAGLYPQLEQSGPINPGYSDYGASRMDALSAAGAPPTTANMAMLDKEVRPAASAPRPRYEPDEQTQTGPGEPAWRWHQVALGWNGPVRATDTVSLWLSPPWLTRGLKFVQVALVVLFLYALGTALWRSGKVPGDAPPASGRGIAAAGVAVLMLAVLTGSGSVRAEGFPAPELLDQLRTELLRPPVCAPECGDVLEARLEVAADGGFLLRLRAAAAAPVALPLPPPSGWQPLALLRDGNPTPLARIDAAPWAALTAGVRELALSGQIHGDSADFRFPVPPRLVTVNAPGWQVDGLRGTGLRGDTLQLQRAATGQRTGLLPDPAAPFVSVERRLALDLDWQLTTTVTRIAPRAGAINLAIPLLPGEAVIGDQPLTPSGEVPVTLDPGQQQMQWRSRLPPVAELALVAPSTAHWVEVWRVEASPRWHIAGMGLPSVRTPGSPWSEWHPWPGERLTLAALRPEPVAGPAVTVEGAALVQRTGARGATLTLDLRLRSSLGGDYRLRLPVAGELQRVVVDGVDQTRPEQDGAVVLPLHPGLQTATLEWRLDTGVGTWTATPPLVLPTPAVNVDLILQLPADRWPLWLGGPDIGPAMLYWGVLLVVVGVAVALGALVRRLRLSIPVTTSQWLLLGIGMSTVNSAGSLIVVLWFLALEARRRWTPPARPAVHNLIQFGLVVLTIAAAASLVYTIPQSLLAAPDMQVVGNGSSHLNYRWYQDRTAGALPVGAALSLPLWVYRLAMLAWSLWLVFALLRWVRWGWECLGSGTLWRRGAPRTKDDPPAAAP